LVVINDGKVTVLAGAMALGERNLLVSPWGLARPPAT